MGYPRILLMFGLVLAYPNLVSLSRSPLSSNPAPATVATRDPSSGPGYGTTAPPPGPSPVDCSMKNKIPVLKTVGVKRLKTAKLCQDYCYNVGEAMYFKWKKKTCFCQGVDYKKKKSFFSGPIMC